MRLAYGAVSIPGEREIKIGEHPVTIIVDVANVMGSRPDGWWRDRAGAAVRLHAELVRLAESGRAALPDENGPQDENGPDENDPDENDPDENDPDENDLPEFVMVLEGAAKAGASRMSSGASQVRVVQAPGSGDDAIVAVVRELPGRRVVVTADRELRERCVAAGATILRPGWLLGLLRQ
jgi:8-oxo-dGTP diphosphatase